MSADGKCPLSIVDMLLNDTSTLDVFDKPAPDEDAEVSRHVSLAILSRLARPPIAPSALLAEAAYGRWAVSAGCDPARFGTHRNLIWIFYFFYNPREP